MDILTYVFYIDSSTGLGKTGLTVTVDVYRVTKGGAGISASLIADNQAAAEIGSGFYGYRQTGGDLETYDYLAKFKTASGAVLSNEITTERWDAAERITMAAIATAVWANATRTLTSFSILAADVWEYATRTLTTTANIISAALSGNKITAHRGDTLSVQITGLGTLANRSALYFTMKSKKKDTDDQSLIQIKEGTGEGTGLIRFNGSSATAGDGSLVVDDEDNGDITITLAAARMAELLGDGPYDVQIVRSSGVPVSTLSEGIFSVTGDVTKATT